SPPPARHRTTTALYATLAPLRAEKCVRSSGCGHNSAPSEGQESVNAEAVIQKISPFPGEDSPQQVAVISRRTADRPESLAYQPPFTPRCCLYRYLFRLPADSDAAGRRCDPRGAF